ncbi:E3 ubiquitin-protein ligase RNF12-B [Culex quinquefasciatus]|uniref:E3 ubiquitin-protein ligase RNF12-B n=1 Tax=Culex quinquefasciatus TaxID=7176 RepID=UPI0018E30DE9|nr:E3 ubiquitin-protein ligase RNF12-B [Culex quinquefasciatus]
MANDENPSISTLLILHSFRLGSEINPPTAPLRGVVSTAACIVKMTSGGYTILDYNIFRCELLSAKCLWIEVEDSSDDKFLPVGGTRKRKKTSDDGADVENGNEEQLLNNNKFSPLVENNNNNNNGNPAGKGSIPPVPVAKKPPPLLVKNMSFGKLRSVMLSCTTKPSYKLTPLLVTCLDPASCGDISTVKIEIVEEDSSAPDAPMPASEHEKTVTEAEAELEAKRIEEEGKLAAIQEAQAEPEPAPEPESIPEPPPVEPEEPEEEESEEEEEIVPPREPTPPPPPPPKEPSPEPIKKSPTPEYDSDVELIPPKEDFDPSLWKSVDDIEKQLVDSEGGTKKPKSKEASRHLLPKDPLLS